MTLLTGLAIVGVVAACGSGVSQTLSSASQTLSNAASSAAGQVKSNVSPTTKNATTNNTTNNNHTTSVNVAPASTTEAEPGSGTPWWLWPLIGIGAVAVAIGMFFVGRRGIRRGGPQKVASQAADEPVSSSTGDARARGA
jgi:cobalamin biosynthesis Mg chelatase CobN